MASLLVRSLLVGLVVLLNCNWTDCECHQLPYRERIKTICRNPAKVQIDCYKLQAPTDSTASYRCKDRYYDSTRKKREGSSQRILKCMENGFWSDFNAFTDFDCQADCGVVNYAVGLILNGQKTDPSKWPWHAAIFKISRSLNPPLPLLICGGTLVETLKEGLVVLTAAHCIEEPFKEEDFIVALRAHTSNFTLLKSEMRAKIYSVSHIVKHDDYSGKGYYLNDVAVIRLKESIELDSTVTPACLNKIDGHLGSHQIEIGSVGQFVGLGLYNWTDRDNRAPHLSSANITVNSPVPCESFHHKELEKDLELCGITTMPETIWTCEGDSGGGLMFKFREEHGGERYYVQGILSHAPDKEPDSKNATCSHIAVYTKVSGHIPWIHKVKFSGSRLIQSMTDISCNNENASTLENKTSPRPTDDTQKKYTPPIIFECGIPSSHLSSSGSSINPASWAWNAAIFKSSDGSFKFACGGTLIETLREGFIILTTASCMGDTDSADFRVALGARCRDYLTELRSPDTIMYNVSHIRIHEDYRLTRAYGNDIAALKLDGPICLSDKIKPACLSLSDSTDYDSSNELDQDDGIRDIVGFGHSDTSNNLAPARHVQTKIIPEKSCNSWRTMFKLRSSEICTEIQGSGGLCPGDSGSGMFCHRKLSWTSRKYYLEGIISHGPMRENKESCERQAVLTKVESFIPWIKNIKFPEDRREESANWPKCNNTSKGAVEPTQPPTTWSTPPRIPTTTPTPSPPYNVPTPSVSPFQNIEFEALWYHNLYRQRYGVPLLQLNAELSQTAEYYAELCLKNQNFPLLGKNLFELKESNSYAYKNTSQILRQAMEYWCNQANQYPNTYARPSPFTQITWKLTTHMGLAIKSIGGSNWRRTVVVVTYYPTYNIWTTTATPSLNNIGYRYQG